MRKVIDSKIYDTETAEAVCETESIHDGQSALNVQTSLYRTKKGTFFVAGEGGPGSQWRRQVEQNSWTGGSGMRLIHDDQARRLVELHSDPETYARLFGEPEEG